jgi:tetratricopeptide (TPR) repeat protein/tRNA A-37 threonylcarbamoyl transferase component Bud32
VTLPSGAIASPPTNELPPAPSTHRRPAPAGPCAAVGPAIGNYDILGELGRGGMAVVYKARHRRLGRIVALKVLRGDGPSDRARLEREASAVAGLQHPNVVQLYEVGEHAGVPFLAFEYVPGGSLAQRLDGTPLAPWDAAALSETLARAVQAAHDHGIIHRDLKPANVLLVSGDWSVTIFDPSRATHQLKIADFGLAKHLAGDVAQTRDGAVAGTPSYMAPEQAAGGAVGPACDVYALGAILYELLTGRPPFKAATPLETLHLVLTAEPVPPGRLQPKLPRDLETVCLKCLENVPGRRYPSAGVLADDLQRYRDGRPVLARPIGRSARAARWARRNPRVAGLLAALAAAIGLGFAGVFAEWRESKRLYALAEERRSAAESNLRRYQQAADDFAEMIDRLDTDQLFHLRVAPLRPELLQPALRRNEQFLERYAADTNRRADVVRAHFRVAVLTRLRLRNAPADAIQAATQAGRRALAELEAFAGQAPDVIQYRRDRAALTHNLGYLLHLARSEEALQVLESACRMRQELLDGQPNNLDYRSEVAGCWNDIGLNLYVQRRFEAALDALDRAIELQRAVVEAAPQVDRYRRLLCNHHYNRQTNLRMLGRRTEALAAMAECERLLPHDLEQWTRQARVMALLADGADRDQFIARSLAALRRAVDLGFDDVGLLRDGRQEFVALHLSPEFWSIVRTLDAGGPRASAR